MNTFNMTCAAVEVTLHDYVDETLEEWVREPIEEHLSECVSCAALARDLRNNMREAAALPALLPERDPWPGIAGRIGAPVIVAGPLAESAPSQPTTAPIAVASDASLPISDPSSVASEPPEPTGEPPEQTSEPLTLASKPLLPSSAAPAPKTAPAYALPARRQKSWGPSGLGLAAAALILVTAGSTFLLTRQWLGPARTPTVASETGTRGLSSNKRTRVEPEIRASSGGRGEVASDSSTPGLLPGQLGSVVTVSATSPPPVPRSAEEVVYDKEIKTLQRIVRRQKPGLDASTVAVIEKNLRSVDAAIAQIRAALQEDPGNSVLGGQASRALEMKVELLRRTAMLRASTSL